MTFVDYHLSNRTAYITLNRPNKRNALNFNVVSELTAAFLKAGQDDGAKVVILRSTGDVFCAGADLDYLKSLRENTFDENLQDSLHLKDLYLTIYTLSKPVIAQVHGPALAGGCGLASVCDFIYAANTATFGYTEARIGFVPALVMVFLLRRMGEGNVRRLLLSGEVVSAPVALQLGLVNQTFPPDALEQEVDKLAHALIHQVSGQSMATIKKMLYGLQRDALDKALYYAAETNAIARDSEDCRKGIDAFLSKQNIQW